MSTYQQDPVTGEWKPAVPLPWMEEHSLFARVVFFLRGQAHCGKGPRQWNYHSSGRCKCCVYWSEGKWDGAAGTPHTCGKMRSER